MMCLNCLARIGDDADRCPRCWTDPNEVSNRD